MDLRRELEERSFAVERLLSDFLPPREGYQRTVLEAMSYALLTPGKRLRPILMQESAKLFGKESAALPFFMAAIEMIHAYSLVHDDLPAMDNDLLRRGKPSTHAKFGEAMGILAGDALLNYAFETALKALTLVEERDVVSRALAILAQKAGVYGMIGGQVVDVESEHILGMDKHRLDYINELKTGALLEASMCIGALLGGANDKQLLAIEQAAAKIGMAFQIQDDILDVLGDEQMLGKPIGSDARNHKVTYVTFVGPEKAKEDVSRLTGQALDLLRQMPKSNPFLEELVSYLSTREK